MRKFEILRLLLPRYLFCPFSICLFSALKTKMFFFNTETQVTWFWAAFWQKGSRNWWQISRSDEWTDGTKLRNQVKYIGFSFLITSSSRITDLLSQFIIKTMIFDHNVDSFSDDNMWRNVENFLMKKQSLKKLEDSN